MSLLTIFTESEQREFDRPPILSQDSRTLCFHITDEVDKKIHSLRTPTNKVGFLLQYGYFKASKRFFLSSRFRREDIEHVAMVVGVSIENVDLSKYVNKIPKDHRNTILNLLNYEPFDIAEKTWFKIELANRIEQFTDPRALFLELLALLHGRRIEIPSYHCLSKHITQHYLIFENKLLAVVKKELTDDKRSLLESLLITNNNKGTLSNFKVINQATTPKAIQASLNIFDRISKVFMKLLPVIEALNLTHRSCQYYAAWVKKAKLSQIKQFPESNKKYLHLIAFIQHQYYLRQDAFVDIFLKCVRSSRNTSLKRLQQTEKLSRNDRRAAVQHVAQSNRSYRSLVDEITEVTKSVIFTDSYKVEEITRLLDTHGKQKSLVAHEKMDLFERSLDSIVTDKDYFDILEKLSVKLQRRVSGIVNALFFNNENSSESLTSAINYFSLKKGDLDNSAPTDFLPDSEKKMTSGKNSPFRVSLYKILLFIHMANAIKSGELNLKYSYQYLSVQDYMIDEATWKEQRENLIAMAGLLPFKDIASLLQDLKQHLDKQYQSVNKNLMEGHNPYLSVDEEDVAHISTPALEEKETEHIASLLDQNSYMPILRVLSDIDRATKFSSCLKHHSVKNSKRRSKASTFHAGVVALGCNIGVPKMGQISSGVNENTLANTVNWYFSRKTLHDANQCIVNMINKLSLSSVYVADKNMEHGSSDGSKFGVAVDSLLASYSFKYFGKDKGVSVYTFIDERQALFHSLVMSACEREAAYVIDGLNNHDVPKIEIHSTDTHGYTESIFAATHMLGISFAPRLKAIGKQKIYSLSGKDTYKSKGYKILPSRPINQGIIRKHWDDILRFMATIKLKKVAASQLFKRLSSYTRNNPLYKAIKEFGRITKSMFILSYYDDVELRQRIEKQLNRVELSNKFSNAVFYANNAEFKQGSPEEQEVTVACKTLIQNCIVLWNYLYLSELLANCIDIKERYEMVRLIKAGSVITWRHINLHGEFDCRHYAANENTFNMEKILALRLA